MKLLAANDRLIIEIITETETTTPGGLILSAEAKGIKYERARVVCVGPNVPSSVGVRVDDVIVIKSGTYFDLKLEDKEYKIIDAVNALAILRA
jgi:co-chaperonin GroES (HSP10)